MGRILRIVFLLFQLISSFDILAQAVVVSSYYNAIDPRDEWTELLVVSDNTDMRNWTLQDNNSEQKVFQPWINFANITLWNNLRAGTIIMVWHRGIGSTGTIHPIDQDKSDGYIEVSANDPSFFILTNAAFGTSPLFAGATLNVAAAGDLLQLLNSSGTFVHALGHIPTIPPPPPPAPGGSWHTIPLPKLNHKSALSNGEAVFVCPGSNINEYGWNTPQDGTTWTSKSSTVTTFGLPNQCTTSASLNSDFWRSLRQPDWINPTLTGVINANNTQVTLNWSLAEDLNPADGTQGYIVLRNTTGTFASPIDGKTYSVGEQIIPDGPIVVALINTSQTHTFVDNFSVPCPYGIFYSVYAFRYSTDNLNGNNYHIARGRAYNENSFASCLVEGPMPLPPLTAVSDRNGFCADDPGNITLSASGGSGTTLNWYSGSCGGTLIGAGSGTGNSITIPSPDATTTYFARWENACGNSSCTSVTVTVNPINPVSVVITADPGNTVCTGTVVTYTATPTNGGTTPVYQWKVNGGNAGSNSPIYTYTPVDGDIISCVLTSNSSCASGNPATSNNIIMNVNTTVPVEVTIQADPGTTVCTGTVVTYTATPTNGGTTPIYQWKVNGGNAGSNSPTYTYTPVDGDIISCVLTSNSSCASGNPASSNNIIMEVSSSVAAGISIAANPGTTICKGTVVIFTANAVNGGALPLFQWYKNGVEVSGNSVTWSDIPADGDVVYCMLTSSLSCVAANPVTSAPLTFTAAPSPQVELTDKEFLCAGQLVMLDAGMGFSSYLWQDGSTDQFYSAIDEGQYYVTVTDALGCTGSDTVYFKKCGQMLYAPTAFSPNGDNLNDQFRLIGNIDNLSSFSMQIFNRWGELIFDANDIQKGWNGTQNGKYCQQDTYTWVVSYQVSSSSPDAKPVILKGTVTLIR